MANIIGSHLLRVIFRGRPCLHQNQKALGIVASVLQHPLLEHLGAQVGGVHLLGAGHRPIVPGLGVRLLERRLILHRGRHGAGDILGYHA